MEDARLAPALEAAALIRRVQVAGGFATVLRKGDADHGTLLLVLRGNGGNARIYERVPTLAGRQWHCAKQHIDDESREFTEYWSRRSAEDRDLWVIELDIAQAERFIGLSPPVG